MKNIKTYKLFESYNDVQTRLELDDLGTTLSQVEDIFLGIKDYGLKFSDAFIGYALSMGDKDIVYHHNHMEFQKSYRSLTIRLKPIYLNDFYIEDGLFNELRNSIGHIESELELKLDNINLSQINNSWYNSVDKLEETIDKLISTFDGKNHLKWLTYLDLSFRITKSIVPKT